MPITVSIAQSSPGNVTTNRTMNFVATVTNTGASAVTLQTLQIVESTESDAAISQPVILTPNTPVGVGNPIIGVGASASFGFSAIFNNPNMAGPSPQHPGGAAPMPAASVGVDALFQLQAIAMADTVASYVLPVMVLAANTNDPAPLNGGALWGYGGANAVNFLTSVL